MTTTTINSPVLRASASSGRGFENLRAFFEIAGAAIRCAAAVDSGYRPNERDLKALGISEVMSRTPVVGR